MRHTNILLLFSVAAYSQAPAEAPAFEVVSIRQSNADPMKGIRVGSKGGPGTADPTRFAGQNLTLNNLITQAYPINHWQLSANGMGREMFDVVATMAEGTTKEQFQLMMQRMLVERFGLKIHWETKEMPRYELVVAKGGPKFKVSPGPEKQNDSGNGEQPMRLASDGYPELAPGRTGSRFMGGKARMQMVDVPVSRLAGMLSGQLRGPVEDMTGLTDKYDLALFWNTSDTLRAVPPVPGTVDVDTSSGPTIYQALKDQLGLVLEKKTGPVKMLVVDHFEKLPTAN